MECKIVQCTYSIHYLADVDACLCCESPPGFQIPIQIYQIPPNIQPIAAPQNWNPEILPANNLVFDAAYTYNLPPVDVNMPEPAMPFNGMNQAAQPNMGFQYPDFNQYQQPQQYQYQQPQQQYYQQQEQYQQQQQQGFGIDDSITNQNMKAKDF